LVVIFATEVHCTPTMVHRRRSQILPGRLGSEWFSTVNELGMMRLPFCNIRPLGFDYYSGDAGLLLGRQRAANLQVIDWQGRESSPINYLVLTHDIGKG